MARIAIKKLQKVFISITAAPKSIRKNRREN